MWDKVIALNLTAPAIVSGRAIRKWLEERKKGSIVNIASIAGFRGFTCGILPAIYISLVPVSVC
jgi:NAD(P)-dependent dehydrogenase (short-subunit alcohol dehydrogenase family)